MVGKYIKDKKYYIVMFIVFVGVFGMLTFLYGLQIEGILYGTVVCAVTCILFGAADFVFYRKKHIQLQLAKENIINYLELPECKSLLEEDYQENLIALHKEFTNNITKSNLTYSEMKDFYALWVHQIKTPIAAMSILLQNDEFDSAKVLRTELFKIEMYTELVLNYLRLEDISSDLSLNYYNLEFIVKQVIKKFAPIFIYKNISVSLENLNIKVLTDEKWLTFAIEQLISNCLKYTNTGGKVNLFCEGEDLLVIEDSGIGILPEDLPRIFEKGFTGYNGRMDKKATGIGLYLTKRTLDKLGHKIEIASDGKKGTRVVINMYRKKSVYE